MIRSKYEEDVFPTNHTTVFGSYWHAGQWGYKCCHAFIKNSYCTGEAGKFAIEAIQSTPVEAPSTSKEIVFTAETSDSETKSPKKVKKPKKKKNEDESDSESGEASSSSSSSESSSQEEVYSKTERKTNAKRNKRLKQKEKLKNKKNKNKSSLEKALDKEEQSQRDAERLLKMDERKRPYNSMYQVKEPTNDEIEAFQMKRRRDEDPMAQFNL